MLKFIWRVVLVLMIGLVTGILGLLAGVLIGGNYAEQFIFNGVQGYEATGQIGLILGAIPGCLLGAWLLFRQKPKNGKSA